ncbi:hypothetical protein TVAG_012930 [Trichomonas vaginalis G3]|uniref:Uncharacterized protein n=1 Tax=Trichomonas vaginalis (strain ATCC PRA-98 / G3) TaxID=412133 RepID=A2DD49_TRIV3|nr:hypothetical protein TVAGG3_0987910 [Trichomonas vaginalis G3]EAY21528.1 hypothetical protein TVAG_012930 [Trichomonas vaginalis G3]KAI5489814.1 hypothetical protein TVAGG3_0987910 [Trichomonas vaginalis G3]|eukprot:XP_001582514.1 hypothetical protein [Trichomonas vaginalis G3]
MLHKLPDRDYRTNRWLYYEIASVCEYPVYFSYPDLLKLKPIEESLQSINFDGPYLAVYKWCLNFSKFLEGIVLFINTKKLKDQEIEEFIYHVAAFSSHTRAKVLDLAKKLNLDIKSIKFMKIFKSYYICDLNTKLNDLASSIYGFFMYLRTNLKDLWNQYKSVMDPEFKGTYLYKAVLGCRLYLYTELNNQSPYYFAKDSKGYVYVVDTRNNNQSTNASTPKVSEVQNQVESPEIQNQAESFEIHKRSKSPEVRKREGRSFEVPLIIENA